MEQSLYAQVIMFRRKGLKFDAANENKNKSKFNFKVNPEDHDYGLILIKIELKCFLALVNLISIRNSFNFMKMSKTQIHSKHFKFQSEMQKL